MMRWDVINFLIGKHGLESYLEIGVQDYYSNFEKIKIKNKVSVDPYPRNLCDFVATSDEFFNQIDSSDMYDIIFIDGLHHSKQVVRDIYNSLDHLRGGGFIVIHDCLPKTEHNQIVPDHGAEWTGDVWKAFVHFRCSYPHFSMYTVDTDWGCGIITNGYQTVYNNGVVPENLNWEHYNSNRNEMMNVVSVEDFTILN